MRYLLLRKVMLLPLHVMSLCSLFQLNLLDIVLWPYCKNMHMLIIGGGRGRDVKTRLDHIYTTPDFQKRKSIIANSRCC